jgi:hypothetical protein
MPGEMPTVYEQADTAVADKLKIDGFIEEHWDEIEKRVLDVESRVAGMGQGANVIFVAECLPFVAGIVHVGSTLDKFRDAKKWVEAQLPHADAVSVLSALTFLYVVDKGKELAKADPEKLKKWQSIQRRVNSLLDPPNPPTAPA